MKKIKRALISVSDKRNLRPLLTILKKNKVEIIKSTFIPTEKNSPIEHFLPSCGFDKEGDYWIYHVEKPFKSPDFVNVEVTNV